MKSNYLAAIALNVFALLTMTAGSFATTKPLNYPKGLAVDAKGNLYVANSGGNDILVYNPSYGQIAKGTVTQNISNPSAVAIDSAGNLWVANYGTSNGGSTGSIAEYTSGVQNANGTITNGVLGPESLAVDGAGNVWVNNAFSNITLYAPPALYTNGGFTLAKTFAPSPTVYALLIADGDVIWGTNSGVDFASETYGLLNGSLGYQFYGDDTGIALTSDSQGNIYMGNIDGSVNIANGRIEYLFVQLAFAPAGAAVDNLHGRVFFSDSTGNSIYVYSTSGTLLHVIH
jgi:ligand-binding sensor domain-containing protein